MDAMCGHDAAQALCERLHPLMNLAEFNDPGEMAAVIPSRSYLEYVDL